MNDFTKEELGFLLNALKYYDIDTCFDPFKKKIQSMIDSYCEHESADIDYDYQALRCKKCKEIVE